MFIVTFLVGIIIVGLIGRAYIHLFSPQGVTWSIGILGSAQTIYRQCTRYMSLRDYWTFAWGLYFNCGDPDPFPCLNIPIIFINWLLYVLYTRLIIPWLFGRVPLRYVYYERDYQGKKPLLHGDSSNLDDYDIRHVRWIPIYSPYFQ
jgi:hypothetical protein